MRLFHWFRRRIDEDDFGDELRAHLAIAEREKMADGASRDEAHYAALREFGNVRRTTEDVRQVWRPGWLTAAGDLASDVRYAVRSLAKTPAFAATVVAVLTVGIGLNAAVFTMLKSVALSPIAGVADSAHLAVLFGETSSGRQLRVSWPDFQFLRSHDRVFQDLFGSSAVTLNLGRGREARQTWGEVVTGNYFQALGIRAETGRTLLPSDDVAPGRHPVAVISHALWTRDFGADPAVVGRTIAVNNYPLTVVGVADPSFHGTIVSYDVEVFIPVMMAAEIGLTGGIAGAPSPNLIADGRARLLFPHGYLRPGVSVSTAAAELGTLWDLRDRDRPPSESSRRLRIVPFWQSPTGGQTYVLPTLILIAVMGLLVLAVACANLAGLVLVRGASRRGEMAMRLALGASRARIVRLLMIENLVLAVPGAVIGVALAERAVPVLLAYAQRLAEPQRIFFNVAVDGMVIAFTALVACGCALVFGFVPALQSSRVDLLTVINEDASPRGAARGRFRSGLVAAQVAVSILLLVGAGLTATSVDRARRAYPGFDPDHVTAVTIDVTQNGYDERRGRAFYRDVLDAVRRDPDVESAALAAFVPLALLETRASAVRIDGYTPRRGEDVAFMSNAVTADYFRTLRIPLVAGRAFEASDDRTGTPVAIVNRTFAERFWGTPARALGRRLRVGESDWRTVVGVAADVKYLRIDEAPRPYFYLPLDQSYRSTIVLHTRGALPVDRLVQEARAHVEAIDPDLPVIHPRSMIRETHGAFIFYELAAMMLAVFGAAGMALAGLGTYGLVSYSVSQSAHEIGIRMALGASARSVVCRYVMRGLRLGAVGAAAGLMAALAVTGLIGRLLYGVSATDGVSFAAALATVLGGVLVATLVPAWRASRTGLLTVLRHR